MYSKFLDYLKNSNERMMSNPVGEIAIGGLRVYIKEPLPDHVDVEYCFSYILEKMPRVFYNNLDKIFIGQFPFLKKREVDAVYKDGSIYITNNQETNDTFIADIIHEVAHAFEDSKQKELYDDETIKKEFLSKRKALLAILKNKNFLQEPITEEDFYKTEYSAEFDNFLYKTVGYSKLEAETRNIFLSPYAATCLREYFANAFEIFFVKDLFLVKKHAPSVYTKLINYLEF